MHVECIARPGKASAIAVAVSVPVICCPQQHAARAARI
jgi:hypothetical protein